MEKFKIFCAFLLAATIILAGSGYNERVTGPSEFYSSNVTSTTGQGGIRAPAAYERARSGNKDRNIAESVVLIEVYADVFGEIEGLGTATAFSVKYDSKENVTYMITNNHVCENDSPFMFLSYIKQSDPIPDSEIHEDRKLEIIATDKNNDLCLVKAHNEKIRPVSFKPSRELKVMDNIYSIGAPRGVYPIWISGKFSGYVDKESSPLGLHPTNSFMLISSIIVGGQSGSPVYDDSGEVVGVIFATLGSYGGFASPSESIVSLLEANL
jgi:S1-C subfamily serine protease